MAVILLLLASCALADLNFVEVRGSSLEPYIYSGELVVFTTGVDPVRRGDIVLFTTSSRKNRGRVPLVKVVVGVPGESLDSLGVVPAFRGDDRIPPDHYFLSSANRRGAMDSRRLGIIPRYRIYRKMSVSHARSWQIPNVERILSQHAARDSVAATGTKGETR